MSHTHNVAIDTALAIITVIAAALLDAGVITLKGF